MKLGQGNIFTSMCQEFCPQGGGEGVCLSACWDTPPRPGTPPPQTRPPRDQAHPPRTRHTPPGPGTPPGRPGTPPGDQAPPWETRHPPGSRLQHTVNERPVRILLECILV